MANNRIRWEGLDELKAELRRLPAELAQDASAIVFAHADGALGEIRDAYPTRTGNLRKGLRRTVNAVGRFGAGALVKNVAPHAWIFEHGTQARHTAIGANRGAMPAGRVFIPIVMRWRRKMYLQLAALLERHGLRTSGSPDNKDVFRNAA